MSDVPSLKPSFAVGITARNKVTGQERIIRQINPVEGGSDHLLVRQHEGDEKSILYTWNTDTCEPVNPSPAPKVGDKVTVGENPIVGTITDSRPHRTTGQLQYKIERLIGTSNKADWIGAGPHIHIVESAAPVAYDSSPTDTDELPVTSSDSAQVDALNLDDMPLKPVGADDDALFRAATELAREQELRADAEERAKVAEKLAKELEKKLVELQNMVANRQPIPVQQRECFEVKTTILKVGFPEHDAEYARMLNDGWKDDSVSSVITSDNAIYVSVVFKKLTSTPSQPTIPNGTHAQLTGDFVQQQRQSPFRSTKEVPVEVPAVGTIVIEGIDNPNPVPSVAAMIHTFGFDETKNMLNRDAVEKAFERGRQRIDEMPVFNRSLHQLAEGN